MAEDKATKIDPFAETVDPFAETVVTPHGEYPAYPQVIYDKEGKVLGTVKNVAEHKELIGKKEKSW